MGVNTLLIEYVPLKQGLRQKGWNNISSFQPLIEYVPLKQGLRHAFPWTGIWILSYPHRVCSIKTRIKTLYRLNVGTAAEDLIEYVPLKQGLRPNFQIPSNSVIPSHRVCSIKTRIKTACLSLQCSALYAIS